jgi:predicted Zn-dependent peptidase
MISLTLAGDLDETEILARLAARMASYRQTADVSSGTVPARSRVVLPDEPPLPVRASGAQNMDVAAPSFLVGIKDPALAPGREMTGRNLVERQRAARLLFDTLLSPVSPLYDSLYADGLINDSFGFHYACEESFAFLACGGESSQPEQAAITLRDNLVRHFTGGIAPELFDIQKRAAAGDFVRSLDSVEHSGLVQAQCNLHGIDLYDYPELYDKMDCNTACGMMAFLADPASYSVALLHPLEVTATHE